MSLPGTGFDLLLEEAETDLRSRGRRKCDVWLFFFLAFFSLFLYFFFRKAHSSLLKH